MGESSAHYYRSCPFPGFSSGVKMFLAAHNQTAVIIRILTLRGGVAAAYDTRTSKSYQNVIPGGV